MLALAAAAFAAAPAPAASADISRAAAIEAVRALPAASSGDLAGPTVTFQATRSKAAWTVIARRPSSVRPLGTWTVDAGSGRILGGGVLPEAPAYAEAEAESIARRDPKAAAWLERFDRTRASATYDDDTRRYTVRFRSLDRPEAGTVAEVVVDGTTGEVRESWTGPQVAWKMARGYKDAFGRRLNRPALFLAFCLVFLVGLLDWRRPLALRNLDLLVLLSFAASLAFFNEGLIFWSVPLSYPPLLYLIARLGWIGARGPSREAWTGRLPIWALAGAAVFLLGFRGGLNAYDATVIDVGYAGVVGADRIVRGITPYETIPVTTGKPCGVRYSDGSRAPIASRTGAANRSQPASTRTAPPATPRTSRRSWPSAGPGAGQRAVRACPRPMSRPSSSTRCCALGLLLLGRRLRGWPLGVALAFAWLAYPFTTYAMQSNTNDPILTAALIWAMVAALSPFARGALIGLAAAVKFAPLLLLPLAARYPRRRAAPVAEWPYAEPTALADEPDPHARPEVPPARARGAARRDAAAVRGGPARTDRALGDRARPGRRRRSARLYESTFTNSSSSASRRSRCGSGTWPSTCPAFRTSRTCSRFCGSARSPARCWSLWCPCASTCCGWRRSPER